MIVGDRDWFWRKFWVGVGVFAVLLLIFCGLFYYILSMVFGSIAFSPYFYLAVFGVAVFLSVCGAFPITDALERMLVGDGRYRGN